MDEFVAIDCETANAFMGSICQIGAVRFRDGVVVDSIDWLVDAGVIFDSMNMAIHGITDRDVVGQPRFAERHGELSRFIGDTLLVCHTHFDRVAIAQACAQQGVAPIGRQWLDSARVARRAWPDVARSGYGLGPLSTRLGITFQHHNACEDARAAGLVLLRAIEETGIALADWPARAEGRLFPGSASPKRQGIGDGPLTGESLVFTGQIVMVRHEAADRAAAMGADVTPSVTKKTTMVVVGDQDLRKLHGAMKSAKHRKAEDLIAAGQPIRIVAECDFMAF